MLYVVSFCIFALSHYITGCPSIHIFDETGFVDRCPKLCQNLSPVTLLCHIRFHVRVVKLVIFRMYFLGYCLGGPAECSLWHLCVCGLQDIRKFFSGGASAQSKPKEAPCKPSVAATSAKTTVKVADKKPAAEKIAQQKSKTTSKTASSKPLNNTCTESDDICIIDSGSESEDFSSKQSKKNLNNNDVKASKQSKSKSSKNKESSSTTDVSEQQRDSAAEKQHSSVSENKASGSERKRSKGKRVKDEPAGCSSKTDTTPKSDGSRQQVTLFWLSQWAGLNSVVMKPTTSVGNSYSLLHILAVELT